MTSKWHRFSHHATQRLSLSFSWYAKSMTISPNHVIILPEEILWAIWVTAARVIEGSEHSEKPKRRSRDSCRWKMWVTHIVTRVTHFTFLRDVTRIYFYVRRKLTQKISSNWGDVRKSVFLFLRLLFFWYPLADNFS